MNAWSMIIELVDEELMSEDELAHVERIVRSAALARVGDAREVVAQAIVERLQAGASVAMALDVVEELVAIRHNQMLIDAGRRGYDDDEDTNVVRLRFRRSHPVYAA